ncbi:hypothetical protein ACIBL5_12680 [Streptomyces sp. NPDC050516]|uniref:hypothetical protein n=1 Tax=Streptomyces sp. NPDC050516 TaxID=3365621 RepID=UPI0037A879A2
MSCPVCSSRTFPCRGGLAAADSAPSPGCPLSREERARRIERRERLRELKSRPEWNQGRPRGRGSRLSLLAWAVIVLVVLVLFLL